MNSISTKKKSLVTNSNARKSKKKSHYQYGGSSKVFKKIFDKRAQKSVPSEIASISSQDFSSMSLEEKKAVLAERKTAIRTKKLDERKKKRKLKSERKRLRTKKQKALKAQKLAREKAKKKKLLERKKARKEKEKARVTQGVQQMPTAPGMAPGMVQGQQPYGMVQGQQPYGMVQGQQPGMLPMGMSPTMIQGMPFTGMGAPGQYQIAPGMTAIDAIDESSLEEMVSMLKNFEGNEYQQTARLILTEDVYITFNTAFKKFQQVIENVYKINKDTLNKAIKDRLDRDIEKRKKIHDKSVEAARRSKKIEHQRLENEASRRNVLFKMTQQSQSLISKPAKQEAEELRVAEINYNLVSRLMEFLILYAKYPQLFILSKHMKQFEKPIKDINREGYQTSKTRKPNIISSVQLSNELIKKSLPKIGFLELTQLVNNSDIKSLFTPTLTSQSAGAINSRYVNPGSLGKGDTSKTSVSGGELGPPIFFPANPANYDESFGNLEEMGIDGNAPVPPPRIAGGDSPVIAGGDQAGTAGGDSPVTDGGDQAVTSGGDSQVTAGGDQAVTSGGDSPVTAGGDQAVTSGGDSPVNPTVQAVSGSDTKTKNYSGVNYRESILELLKDQRYDTLFLLLNPESKNESNKNDFSTFKNDVLKLKYKILNKEKYFVVTRQKLEELPKENLPPSLVTNNLNKCLILKNQDDDGIYFFTNLDEEENTIDLGKIRTELNSYKLVVVCKNEGGKNLTESGFELGYTETLKTTIKEQHSIDHYILSLNYLRNDRNTEHSPVKQIDKKNFLIETLTKAEKEKLQSVESPEVPVR